jgi:hypothetical protein
MNAKSQFNYEELKAELAQVIYDSMGKECAVKTVHSSDNERLSVDTYEEGHYRDSAGMIEQYMENNWYFESDTFPVSSLRHLFAYAASKNQKEQRHIAHTLNLDIRDTIKVFKNKNLSAHLALSILNDTSIDLMRMEREFRTGENTMFYIEKLSSLVMLVSQKFAGEDHAQALAHYLEQRQDKIKDSEYRINLCETLLTCYPEQIQIFSGIDIVKEYLHATSENDFAILPVEKSWSVKMDLQKFQHLFLLPSWTLNEYSRVMGMLMQEIEKQGKEQGIEDLLIHDKYDEHQNYQYSVITLNASQSCNFSEKNLLNIIKEAFNYLKHTNTVLCLDVVKSQGNAGNQIEDIKNKFSNTVKKIMLYQKINENLQQYEAEDNNENTDESRPKLKI